MGNLATVIKRRTIVGNKKRVYVDVTGSASYATNGDILVAADIDAIMDQKGGAEDMTKCDIFLAEETNGGHSLFLDRANKKIKFFNGTVEIANATNLAAFTARVAFEFGDDPASTV